MGITRRRALKDLGLAGAGLAISGGVIRGQSPPTSSSPASRSRSRSRRSARLTVRITVRPIRDGAPAPIAHDRRARAGRVRQPLGTRTRSVPRRLEMGSRRLRRPLHRGGRRRRFTSRRAAGAAGADAHARRRRRRACRSCCRRARCSASAKAACSSIRRARPIRCATARSTSQADGYRLAIHGTRAPVQWLVGTDGWAMFIHQPYGAFDFTGAEGKFTPRGRTPALPLDVFVVALARSAGDHARVRAHHRAAGDAGAVDVRLSCSRSRTLAGPDEILGVARTFREKKLPCDALIYLGTEFAPSGWNTRNGEFTWHPTNFPDPKKMIDAAARRSLQGRRARRHRRPATASARVSDPCTAAPLPPGRTAGQSVAARSPGLVLLAGAQAAHGRRRRRLVARSGRRLRRPVAIQPPSHVLGRHAAVSARTSGRSRCIATRRPAFSASADSSGRATCRRGGRR